MNDTLQVALRTHFLAWLVAAVLLAAVVLAVFTLTPTHVSVSMPDAVQPDDAPRDEAVLQAASASNPTEVAEDVDEHLDQPPEEPLEVAAGATTAREATERSAETESASTPAAASAADDATPENNVPAASSADGSVGEGERGPGTMTDGVDLPLLVLAPGLDYSLVERLRAEGAAVIVASARFSDGTEAHLCLCGTSAGAARWEWLDSSTRARLSTRNFLLSDAETDLAPLTSWTVQLRQTLARPFDGLRFRLHLSAGFDRKLAAAQRSAVGTHLGSAPGEAVKLSRFVTYIRLDTRATPLRAEVTGVAPRTE